MDLKSFFRKNWPHFAVIAVFFIISFVFYQPAMNGMDLKQHDVEQWKGMSNEIQSHREKTGEEPLWTNSMFGGMPATQISMTYPGNVFQAIRSFTFNAFPQPIALLLLHLIGFYIFCIFLRINPIIGVLGAIAFSFASYEIIIVQAGHGTKSLASAFLAPALGAFIYAFRTNWKWGSLWFAFFMVLQLGANHLQVTYYFTFLLGAVGIYFFIDAIQKKKIKRFGITSTAVIAGVVVAILANAGNILGTQGYGKYTTRGENDLTIQSNGEMLESEQQGLDKDYITNWSYGIGETFTFVSPNVKGGGSFSLGGSQFEETLEGADLKGSEINDLRNMPAYWGDQPITSGPVYLGVVVVLLSLLALVFSSNMIKWPLFVITVLAVALSWGKNFMFLTDFFIDYVPGYDKFRTVTIILIIVELVVAVLGVIFLSQLIKEREKFREKKQLFIGVIGGFFAFLLIVKMTGIGDNYTSEMDSRQLENVEKSIRKQISETDPAVFQTNYGIDVRNPKQLNSFVDAQLAQYEDNFTNLRVVRKDIFHASMNRSLIFTFFGGLLLILFVYMTFPAWVLTGGLLVIVMADMIPVAYDYIGDEEKYWADAQLMKYPIAANIADETILESEVKQNPSLKKVIEEAEKEARSIASEEELVGSAKSNFINSKRFQALNSETNYRVFDLNGNFNSSRASYFHKSLGGYHGAKLRNIANLIDFHLGQLNENVLNMLNVKYFIQNGQKGPTAVPRPSALGNAWFVKSVEEYETPNDEIRALGNKFKVDNVGAGELLVNNKAEKSANVYGREKLQYVLSQNDTLNVPLRNGLREGEGVLLVMDTLGNVDFVPQFTIDADTVNSFTQLVRVEVVSSFQPKQEAVMLSSEAKELSAKSFSGEGSIKMKSYAPNKLVYTSESKEKQLAVFSEIYYPLGWTATIDGKEAKIMKVNYLLRGLEVPEGKHTIEFTYDSPSYHKSNTISYAASYLLIALFIFLGFTEWRKRKNGVEGESEKQEVREA